MVMRATASFSVGPTVRESMLMARRRAREETRFRTPGLFSTYAISVCICSSSFEFCVLSPKYNAKIVSSVARPRTPRPARKNSSKPAANRKTRAARIGYATSLWFGGGFYQGVVRTANHFVQRRACGNHWVDGVFLFDAEGDRDGVFGGAGCANG